MNDSWREGGCHCGAVRFKVRDACEEAILCNCSICNKKGFIHLIVEKENFSLLQGKADLTTYTFNTKTAQHLFCKHCGISPYYIPRSHPDGFDINLRCLDGIDLNSVKISRFDGRNWEANIEGLRSEIP